MLLHLKIIVGKQKNRKRAWIPAKPSPFIRQGRIMVSLCLHLVSTCCLDLNSTNDLVFPNFSTAVLISLCESEFVIPSSFTIVGGPDFPTWIEKRKVRWENTVGTKQTKHTNTLIPQSFWKSLRHFSAERALTSGDLRWISLQQKIRKWQAVRERTVFLL